jgi:hypothetical protein
MALRAQYATPGGAVAAATGRALALAVVGRAGWCLGASLGQARRERRRHAEVLAMVGRAHPGLG